MYVFSADTDLQTFAAYTVTTTAGTIVIAAQTLKAKNVVRVCAPAANTAAIYIGATGVTTATGIELAAGTYQDFYVRDAFKLFAIVASGTQNLRICAM